MEIIGKEEMLKELYVRYNIALVTSRDFAQAIQIRAKNENIEMAKVVYDMAKGAVNSYFEYSSNK